MRILYIGNPHNYELWLEGKNPSHWLYGACEMEEDGHEVIWAQEYSNYMNDLHLLWYYRPDMIFIPNLNLRFHGVLLLLASIGLVRTPIFAYLHRTTKKNGRLSSFLYRLLLSGVKHVFFLSELTMKESICEKYVKKERCSVPGWGADEQYFSTVSKGDNGTFVSTGKEQRDFDILIEAFRRTGAPLKLITCKSHAGNNFENLVNRCKDIPNIEVKITDNISDVYPLMVREMAKAKALVCPLRQDKLSYCVGLSSVTDAEGLRKPLIITHNPYHSEERLHSFHVVVTIEDWIVAIKSIQSLTTNLPIPEHNIKRCYESMKAVMFE